MNSDEAVKKICDELEINEFDLLMTLHDRVRWLSGTQELTNKRQAWFKEKIKKNLEKAI